MANKTLEARFEHLTVNDENEPASGAPTLLKSKVRGSLSTMNISNIFTARRTIFNIAAQWSGSSEPEQSQPDEICFTTNQRVKAKYQHNHNSHDDNIDTYVTALSTAQAGARTNFRSKHYQLYPHLRQLSTR